MKFVSFNVNSVRLRIHQIQAVIDKHQPDVIGLQETKVNDPDFPIEQITSMGYEVAFHGQKTHYGVAMMSKTGFQALQKGFPTDDEDAQRRMIIADVNSSKGTTVKVINGYFPQGESRDHAVKFPAKEKFYTDLKAYLTKHCDPKAAVLVMGDYNVAPVDEDIGISDSNARRWLKSGKTSFLPEERDWFGDIISWGLNDTFRVKYPGEADLFSWFDYRSRGFERDPRSGLRIDHLLATNSMTEKLIDSGIDYDVRSMEKPSDHCPVWSEFNL